jgi:hypothetical protein
MVGYGFAAGVVTCLGLIAAGCSGPTGSSGDRTAGGGAEADHDHDHEHADPKSLAEAVEVLTETRDELAEAYKAANAKTVDEVWHEMYPVAKKAKELAAGSGLDRYDQDDADAAIAQIVEILEELHPPHGADAKVDPAAYEGQADSLDDAIANLKAVAAKVPATN